MAEDISFRMLGVAQFKDRVGDLVAHARASGRLAVAEGAVAIQNQAKKNASGRPGPNVATGRLRSSIHVEGPIPEGPFEHSAKIGPSVVYGRQIELGGGRWTNGAAYPYLRPAIEKVSADTLPAIFRARWSA